MGLGLGWLGVEGLGFAETVGPQNCFEHCAVRHAAVTRW